MDALDSLLQGPGKKGGRQPVLIDSFLAGVRTLGDATPSESDLDVTKRYLALLGSQTATDHLKSVDEQLCAVATEFSASQRALLDAEAFIYLCASGKAPKVAKALEKDWQLLHATDRDGHTALHAAASQNLPDVAFELLKRGANASVQDFEGLTPLHWAVESNSDAVAVVLLQHGADPSIKNSVGATPLDAVSKLKPKQQATWLALLSAPRDGTRGNPGTDASSAAAETAAPV